MEGIGMKLRNELKAGIFVGVSFALIALLILVMGRERQIFAKQSEFYAVFKDVKGLSEGAPVRLGGIPIGRVKSVSFSKDSGDTRVHVTLLINDMYLDRIRPDSQAAIDTQGLLGDRFVSISPGQVAGHVPTGALLPSTEISDFGAIMGRAQVAVENTTQITERINRSLEGLSPDTFTDIASASKSIAEVFKAIRTENGFIHRLIYSDNEGKKLMDGLTKTSSDVSSLISEVKNGQGLIHALIYEEKGKQSVEALVKAIQSITVASDNLSGILSEAHQGKGLLHDLIYTEVAPGVVSKKVEEVLTALAQAAQNLKATSDALAQGQGTLGALIVDPKLYDNLVEVTDGAKRSFILRQAVRSSLKP
jgi:phospholipid/cholesterol/gamma-HCH transport system substrate-binding protein